MHRRLHLSQQCMQRIQLVCLLELAPSLTLTSALKTSQPLAPERACSGMRATMATDSNQIDPVSRTSGCAFLHALQLVMLSG
jgi:hypothetical protein